MMYEKPKMVLELLELDDVVCLSNQGDYEDGSTNNSNVSGTWGN